MASVIFLVPGFLGFTSLGRASYFSSGFARALQDALAAAGSGTVRVVPLDTKPAGSLAARQAKLLSEVALHTRAGETRYHFIGHSTGALDVELMLRANPLVPQASHGAVRAIRASTRTLIGLAGAAGGSGIAASPVGRALAGASPLQASRLAHALGVDVAAGFVQIAAGVALSPSAFVTALSLVPLLLTDPMARTSLFQLFNAPGPVLSYVGQLALHRELLLDLQPRRTRAIVRRAGPLASPALIRRFVTVAPPPRSLVPSASGWLYDLLYAACAQGAPKGEPDYDAARGALAARWTALPRKGNPATPRPTLDARTSDGIVNTVLQLPPIDWVTGLGQIAGLVVADHLDVVGAIPERASHSAEGLLNSGARFGRVELRELCRTMIAELAPRL